MTIHITPLDKQAACPSEHGPQHRFILLTQQHAQGAIYGCQACPEIRAASTVDTPAPIEYWIDIDRNVVRLVNGTPTITVNRRPITLATAYALADALNDAIRRGAAHGPCDWQLELAATRRGEYAPGHVLYRISNAAIMMTVDGQTAVVFDAAKVRPAYLVGDFYNELEYAFRLGGTIARP
jgi:hypothetical protein